MSIVPKYDIKNKEGKVATIYYRYADLKKLIMKYPHGLIQDEDLISCYSEVRQHLKELKSEGWIREFTTEKLKEIWHDSKNIRLEGADEEEVKQPAVNVA